MTDDQLQQLTEGRAVPQGPPGDPRRDHAPRPRPRPARRRADEQLLLGRRRRRARPVRHARARSTGTGRTRPTSAGYFLHMHNITNHTCEIDGDTAHCETYVIGAMLPRPQPGRATFVSGRYVDRLERRDGEWRILVRRTTIEVEVEGDANVAATTRSARPSPRARGTPGTCRTRARCGSTHRLCSGTDDERDKQVLGMRVCPPQAGQGLPQLPARADAKLGVHLAEMPFDGPGAEE